MPHSIYLFGGLVQLFMPDALRGGGERAVLEARLLGVEVEVAEDNPKLAELVTSPIYDHAYYARKLLYGVQLLQVQEMKRVP